MRIEKPGKIEDYDKRDILVAKALKKVKERKKRRWQHLEKWLKK